MHFLANVALVIGMIIFFLVCLPLILLLIFCLYRHREELKQQWPGHSTFSQKYRYVSTPPLSHSKTANISLCLPKIQFCEFNITPFKTLSYSIKSTAGLKSIFLLRKIALPYPHKCLFWFCGAKTYRPTRIF